MAESISGDAHVLPHEMSPPVFPPQGFSGHRGIDWEALRVWVEELVAYKVKEAFQTFQLQQGLPERPRSASSPEEKSADGPNESLSILLGEQPSSSHQQKAASVSEPQKLSVEEIRGSRLYQSELPPKLQNSTQHGQVGTSKHVCESSATPPAEEEAFHGIPLPESFVKLIKREWSSPAKDRKVHQPMYKIYVLSRKYEEWLHMPSVDAPVAALNSVPILPPHLYLPKDAFDRRMEDASRKAYGAASYALRASAAGSIAARASYVLLQDLLAQPDIPSQAKEKLTDIFHATAFTADATLDSLQFSARAMGAAVVIRRNTWLRHWDADRFSKTQLAEAPFKGGMLFGDSLDPFLVETKEKKNPITRKERRHLYKKFKHKVLLPYGDRRGGKWAWLSRKTRYRPYP